MRRTTVKACVSAVLLAALYTGGPAGADVSLVGAVPVATGLSFPAAFTFASDGRIFYGERFSGQIRVFDPSNGSDTLFFTVPDVVTAVEQGLLGLALAPTYPARPIIYAYATRDIGPSNRNQIVRITDVGGTGADMKTIWESDVPAATNHNGGRILFGPDGKLYAITGDAANTSNSQNLGNDAGKVLRLNPNGSIPANNPIPNQPDLDLRPPQLLRPRLRPHQRVPLGDRERSRVQRRGELHPAEPQLRLGTEPDLQLAAAAAAEHQPGRPQPRDAPGLVLRPSIAPTGIAFCVGCGIPSAEGALFVRLVQRQQDPPGDAQREPNRDRFHRDPVHPRDLHPLAGARPDDAVYFSDGGGIWRLVN